jgi:hypothetical protein
VNTPRCVKGKDGRILGPEFGPELRNSRAGVMDMRSGTATWTVPSPEDGGAKNPNIRPGDSCQPSDPRGMSGVPGRSGDGLVGSAVGGSATGTNAGIEHNPTCTPDTGVNNSGDMFCADMVPLADGRMIIVGGRRAGRSQRPRVE